MKEDRVEVPRDRWGKPLILNPLTGERKAYDRASSFGDVLEDKHTLGQWAERMVAKGMGISPHLVMAAAAAPVTDRSTLQQIADEAKTAAGAGRKAQIGTALHSMTEIIDAGGWPDYVPPEYKDGLLAYRTATFDMEMVHVERFMVCDELEVAGTGDRIMREMPDETLRIGDLKTSNSDPKYQGIKFAVQLSIYAHSQFYDPATGERTDPGPIDQERAVVFLAPSGGTTCQLLDIDIAAGWQLALLARDVRMARKTKNLIKYQPEKVSA